MNTDWFVIHSLYLSHLRGIADGSCHAIAIKPESMPPSAFSLSIHNYQPLYRYTHAPASLMPRLLFTEWEESSLEMRLCFSCLFRCRYQHNWQSLYNRCAHPGCLSWLSFLKGHLNTYIRMRPATIALNYSIKNIRNDV